MHDGTAIVHETAIIRIASATPAGRCIDLVLTFTALEPGVTIARRHTDAYGGLNIRLATAADLQLTSHADRPGAGGDAAWSAAIGRWGGSDELTTFAALQKRTNPEYPAQNVAFSKLPWFGPTFPSAGTRYVLDPTRPLKLEYRLWIAPGAASDAAIADAWRTYQTPDSQLRKDE
jgi:hypothetical protein